MEIKLTITLVASHISKAESNIKKKKNFNNTYKVTLSPVNLIFPFTINNFLMSSCFPI